MSNESMGESLYELTNINPQLIKKDKLEINRNKFKSNEQINDNESINKFSIFRNKNT
jgi:hypothetical protein